MKKIIISLCSIVLFSSFSLANNSLDEAVNWMYQNGLTKFDNSTDFMAEKTLRRDEASKFFGQYAKRIQGSIVNNTKNGCNELNDINSGRPDLKEEIKDSCKLGLFQGYKGSFMPQQQLTNGQAITVLIRMIDGKKDETKGHFAQRYFEKAEELGIMNGLNLNSKDSFDRLITRGNIAILLFNTSKLVGTKLNNQDFEYLEKEVNSINSRFKIDSKERQDYLNGLYERNEEKGSKEKLITDKLVEELEKETNTVYLNGFKCNILDIKSMIGGDYTTKDNQIIGIHLDCKNISKTKKKPEFTYIIKDYSSLNTYGNNQGLQGKNGYILNDFFSNNSIETGVIDITKEISSGGSIKGWIFTKVPKEIKQIKYSLSYGNDFGAKRITLNQIILKSPQEKKDERYKQCIEDPLLIIDCTALSVGKILNGIHEATFDYLNNQLKEEGKPYYQLSIYDSNLGRYYCMEEKYWQSCLWISDGEVKSETTVFYK